MLVQLYLHAAAQRHATLKTAQAQRPAFLLHPSSSSFNPFHKEALIFFQVTQPRSNSSSQLKSGRVLQAATILNCQASSSSQSTT
jgi:hypothetical protein